MSQITLLNGPERRRRWSDDERVRILEAAFAPRANVSDVARRFDVSTSLIYQWRALMLRKQAVPEFVPAMVIDEAVDTPVPVREPMIKVQFAHWCTFGLAGAKLRSGVACASPSICGDGQGCLPQDGPHETSRTAGAGR